MNIAGNIAGKYQPIKLLFVCMGNICRSPTAEGVISKLINDQQLSGYFKKVDSAGTHAYHIGETPDPRSQQACRQRGIDISHLQARQITLQDFREFDYILAMDTLNYQHLLASCPDSYKSKLHLFLNFAPHTGKKSIPDPYYGGVEGFNEVVDLCEIAAKGLLTHLKTQLDIIISDKQGD